MFKSLKLYTGMTIDLERIMPVFVEYGYTRQDKVADEGDFARRGGIIDVFPLSFELPIRLELDADTVTSIRAFNPVTGEPLWEHKVVIILPFKRARPRRTTAFTEEVPLSNFVDIGIGDYVVHNQHGIGRFLGMQKIKVKDKYSDHLVIEYDRAEKLFVPVAQMNLVQKYIAFQARKPKLYRLGSKEWLRTKERAKKGIQKLSWELLSLQAMRLGARGHTYSPDTEWQAQFENTFPYDETPGQEKAMEEVKRDMESGRPMDRLLCGDVGYGKTEVAMRAAFKAVMDNKQAAYLVPTTILAEQHYENFTSRLSEFPIAVELLCRFRTDSEQNSIIKGLKRGSVDIVIGTHRLLSGDVSFRDLGLVIIDEEQRFGVRAKEKLKTLRLNTAVLTLTATPIPRTLYMSLMGAKDMSLINTPPQNRLPIKTIVVEYNEDLIVQAILKEMRRGGQVFFLHNRIYDIEGVRDRLQRILPPGARLAIGHGRMHARELEQVMSEFLKGRVDCLISTMIIESGIDVPNANTIIIDNAHQFGLSDLHQLRGRVGRFNRPAYAYLLLPRNFTMDAASRKRLSAIEEYTQLGSGFHIAMEDLEIRGAGNLLGLEQHGFISAIGFDLYCRLLKEAIEGFKKAGVMNA